MAMGVDGLVSGLQTTALIDSLMAAEALPQQSLKAKVTDSNTLITALQGLNSKFAALATQAGGMAKPGGLSAFKATSGDASVTVSTTTGAAPTDLDITVDTLAQTHTIVTGAMSVWPENPPALSFTDGTGKTTSVTAASDSLDDVAKAINSSGAGVNAVKIASGKDASGTTQYRLQLSSTKPGKDAAFTLTHNGTDVLNDPGAALIHQGQDASVRLWAGTTAEQTITSATNTLSALAPGVDVTVSKVSAAPVNITVALDTDKVSATAKDLVTSMNIIFGSILTQSAASSTTDANGKTKVTGGVFASDSNIRDAKQKLFDAVATPIDAKSPAAIGINTTKNGDLVFDPDAFAAAYKADPAATEHALQTIASRTAAASTVVSDKYTGTLTSEINGQQSTVKSLGDQITDWDTRLASRRATLEATYANLEVQLQKLQSQGSWLSGQLSGLPSSSSSSSGK